MKNILKSHGTTIGIMWAFVLAAGSGIVWVEDRHGEVMSRLLHIEQNIIVAIDRNEEWLSKEHQENIRHLNMAFIGLARDIGHHTGQHHEGE